MIKSMSQEFHPIDFCRQVALENRLAQYELYFQFDWEKRKPNSLAYFFFNNDPSDSIYCM